jgi:hypothetical protein
MRCDLLKGKAAAEADNSEAEEAVCERAEEAVRASPFVQGWLLTAVWLVGGLAIAFNIPFNTWTSQGWWVLSAFMSAVLLVNRWIRCPQCRRVVYPLPPNRLCQKCGHSLK